MTRTTTLVIAILCLGGFGWMLSGREQVEERAANLALEFDRSRGHVYRLKTALRAAEQEAEIQRLAARKWRNRYSDTGQDLRSARSTLRRLRDLADVVAPGRRVPTSAEIVPSSAGTGLVIVGWGRAVSIWRLTPSPATGFDAVEWRLLYELTSNIESISIRTSEGETHERFAAANAGVVAVHDLTRDGLPEVVIHARGIGSGGCGVVRVLENGDSLREIFRREDCGNFVQAEDGLLVYNDARSPKGCESIHGCIRRIDWLRWDGHSWEVARTRRGT